ncbi:MAG: SLEI family protein, partial [Leptotrichiaceae bacterium]
MKKIVLLITLIFLFSCANKEQGYNYLEKGLMATLENKDEKEIMKNFNNAANNGNKEVFEAVYNYFGNTQEAFFDKYTKKSKGEAEYYKALISSRRNDSKDKIIKLLESSIKQGNIKSYYTLGTIYQDNLEYTKAQENFKLGKSKGDIYSIYSYEYNKNYSNEYKRIEELNEKLTDNTITTNEKKEMGTLILEKYSNYSKAYDILKEFITEGYPPAMYSKAKMLEMEDKSQEAGEIYNTLYTQKRYYLAAFEIAFKISNEGKNDTLAVRILEDTNSDDSLITGYKGFLYEKLKNKNKALENYLSSIEKNDVDVMTYLGKFY